MPICGLSRRRRPNSPPCGPRWSSRAWPSYRPAGTGSRCARGTIASVAKAFNTEIHRFARHGEVFRANIRNARLSGAAGDDVAAVAGIESHLAHPMLARARNPETGQTYPAIALRDVDDAGGLGSVITDKAFSREKSVTYGGSGGSLPEATYTGIVYDVRTIVNPSFAIGFTATQLQQVYGLDAAYTLGLDGTGQTIVLLEAYGYPDARSDANIAARLNHLPHLTAANFSVIYPEGKPADPNAGYSFGWSDEIALDVQWAHAIAPGARIVVVATNGEEEPDLETSMQYIVDNNVGAAVSDSWEVDTDIYAGPDEQDSFENILIEAAAKGISFQFSTGDNGDNGLGTPRGAAGVPSAAPHATAVGGTSISNDPDTAAFETSGWGELYVYAALDGFIYDPPGTPQFIAGSGGGESVFWPKPAWQSALPGKGRQTPDVSALADPLTGVTFVESQAGTTRVILGAGGTSLASPIFTAFWAIAQQKAGHALGQAAPTIAGLSAGVTDVLALTNPHSVAATITDSNGTTRYSTHDLFAAGTARQAQFLAALSILGSGGVYQTGGVSFGTDGSLTIHRGWDDVTGFGTPDGLAFIDAAAAYGQP
jgi:subtilase family serine protease